MAESPLALTAAEMRDRLVSGALKAVDVARAVVAAVEEREKDIGAWAWFDPQFVLAQAEQLDAYRATGRGLGALHGVPVGIKDIIDTAKIPTENGTAIDQGRIPLADAFVVQRLKQSGAIIAGKTVTTELAFMDPSPTRNPHNKDHTPGGSSAGSAAAVAAGMVPLAIGTQTGGSVIRPAAYCGVVGYKPSFGAIPRTGVLTQAPSLDTIGVMAATIDDAAMLAEVLFGFDEKDEATEALPVPKLFDTARSAPPVKPVLAFVKQPAWEQLATEETKSAFAELTNVLGEDCMEVDLPPAFPDAMQARARIQLAELAKSYYGYTKKGADKLGPQLVAAIESGNAIPARVYISARDWPKILNTVLDEVFDRFDAIITPAAPGTAPEGLDTTGDPAFNGLWTFCGTPAVTIPVFQGSTGLPMGVQLVGRRGDDARLLRTARWLAETLQKSAN